MSPVIDVSPSSPFEGSAHTATSAPNDRDTTDIVWSCLAVIFSCTWVAIHPNVPHHDIRASGWKMLRRRVLLMLWAILVPELMVMWAVRQWFEADQAVKDHHTNATGTIALNKSAQKPKWTRMHGFFLVMGGYSLSADGKEVKSLRAEDHWTTSTHQHYSSRICRPSDISPVDWPTLWVEEIQDKSKGDALAKLLILGQVAWFILQLIARFATHLAVTELEVVTLSYASINALLYFFWWDKPLDVHEPILIEGKPHDTPALSPQPADDADTPRWGFVWGQVIFQLHAILIEEPRSMSLHPLVLVHLDHASKSEKYSLALCGLAGSLFGAIHCIAWRFQFPTAVEKAVWRVASIVVTAAPLLWYLIVSAIVMLVKIKTTSEVSGASRWVIALLESLIRYIGMALVPVILYSYFFARLFLIIESFVSLRSLSPEAFQVVTWTTFIPHI
ncbi:hypothetical protein EYR38_001684 [Pleurotus pulmonarius]|nr:hypothetical protein EYR38_001684 [Pleurotus pulmonarius]